jgi:hypothetical protein
MKKEVKDALNTLKTFLGMEVKLEQMMLVDGVTTIEFDALEVGQNVSIVNEEDRIPLPIGEYELQDGQLLKVLEDGIIGEIGAKQEEEEAPEAEQPEMEEEVEMEVEKPIKKTVESTVKETYFSKEEKENLEKEIEELKAKITELSKVEEEEEVKVELSEEEVKPITFNPENKQQIEVVKLGKGNSKISNILEQVYKFK